MMCSSNNNLASEVIPILTIMYTMQSIFVNNFSVRIPHAEYLSNMSTVQIYIIYKL